MFKNKLSITLSFSLFELVVLLIKYCTYLIINTYLASNKLLILLSVLYCNILIIKQKSKLIN